MVMCGYDGRFGLVCSWVYLRAYMCMRCACWCVLLWMLVGVWCGVWLCGSVRKYGWVELVVGVWSHM